MSEAKYEIPEDLKGGSLPDVLLAYQQELLKCTALSPVTLCEKSRRIGMTWGVGSDAVLHAAASRKAGGMDVLYIGFNLDMTREFIDVCAMWSKAFSHACGDIQEFMFKEEDEGGETKEIKAFRITYASGFEVMALSSKPRSLRGRQGYVIIDEAAFHDDLDELMKAALALLIWGGKVLVISTHDGVDNPFNKLIQNARAKRNNYKVLKVDFNSALKDGLYKRICLVQGIEWSQEKEDEWALGIRADYGEAASEELDCIPKKSSGAYLASQIIEPCMQDVPVVELDLENNFFSKPDYIKKSYIEHWCEEYLKPLLDQLDKTAIHYFGWDIARHCHLSIFAPIFLEKNTRRNIPFSIELRNVPFTQQEQILEFLLDRLPRLSGGFMDATGNGANTAEKMQEKYGAHLIHAIKINVKWYEEALPPYKAAFEDSFIRIPKTTDILQDHRTVQVVRGVPVIPELKDKDGKKRHGDSLVAFAGAYWATMQETNEYGYESAAPRNVAQSFMKPNNYAADIKFNSRFDKGCF